MQVLCIAVALVGAVPVAAGAATDPLLADQWALANPAVVGAQEAWTQSSGEGILVAVLDTGLQLDHPDLAGNVWTNPGEIAGNGIDDDHDAVVDDVHGANMFDQSANVDDDNGHGTHVAGIVAARQGNGIGGSGLAFGAKLLPVKVLDSTMSGTTDTLARGIRYAVDRGAQILNVSVNSDAPSPAVATAVRYAGEHGAVVVSSAGNNARNIDLLPSYAASLSDTAVLSVAADGSDGHLWSQSNVGPLSVDLAAPGQQIVSTTRGSAYASRSGTSAAAPFVAASMALLAAARPDLSMSVLRTTIIATSRRNDFLAALVAGGHLDVGAAMHSVRAGLAWQGAPLAPGGSTPALLLRTASKVRAGSRARLRWSATNAATVTSWRVSLDGRVVGKLAAKRGSFSRRVARSGRHSWRVVGYDAAGAKVVAARRAFRVLARGV